MILSKVCENETDLKIKIKEITEGYNNKVHSVTKFKPNVVYLEGTKAIFKQVKENIDNYYKSQIEKPQLSIKAGIKLLYACQFVLKKKKLYSPKGDLPKKEEAVFHTKASVEKLLNFGCELIKIAASRKTIKRGETYICKVDILCIVSEQNFNDSMRILGSQSNKSFKFS